MDSGMATKELPQEVESHDSRLRITALLTTFAGEIAVCGDAIDILQEPGKPLLHLVTPVLHKAAEAGINQETAALGIIAFCLPLIFYTGKELWPWVKEKN